MTLRRTALPLFLLVLCLLALETSSLCQTETATLSGLITDPQGKVVPDVAVEVTNTDTNVRVHQTTNGAGLYVVVGLKPGRYRVSVTKDGFRRIDLTDLVLNVQDVLSRNFQLQLGPVMASITVIADEAKVNTESATVSTVVDRNFAENLPMNGRSFQSLIDLTPGVVVTPSTMNDSGQFSVNGQRATSNYWMVDGVSGNVGISPSAVPGNGLGGTVGSFSALGGTNSLVSVDAMQEFRIQTSTFAPEFGRTPGGQISIVTRSGTNQFHGTAFDYLRNDALDANTWFGDNAHLAKPQERQNDFGGTLGGPIVRDKTFFFVSYEGLRLQLPQTTLSNVPDLAARQNAVLTMQPYLNAFPLPNGLDNTTTGIAQFNASYSNPATLNAYSLRLDQQVSSKWTLFGRYDYSPSEFDKRGGGGFQALNVVEPSRITTQTATIGAGWTISQEAINDVRFNYSRANAESSYRMDNFGGAVPLADLPLAAPYSSQNGSFGFYIFSMGVGEVLDAGKNAANIQRQINFVDSLSWQRGSHSLKVGIDFRRLSPSFNPYEYTQNAGFADVASAEVGNAVYGYVGSNNGVSLLFRNLGVYAQDTWRASPRLTLTYGLRWDVDFAPSSRSGPSIPAVTGYSLTDLSQLTIASPGTAPFKTTYGNIAPRVGVAYQVSQSEKWLTVLRGGAGVFYDLASSEAGNLLAGLYPPFGNFKYLGNTTFPFTASQIAPPPIPLTGVLTNIEAFNPNLKLPYALEWNLAVQQSLGSRQTLSATYIGAAGRRLIQTTDFLAPVTNPNISFGAFIDNTSKSNYNALQLEFRRNLAQGLQALASYTWSHSIDNASANSDGNSSNRGVPGSGNENRGSSDFDIRHAFTAGLTYEIPARDNNAFARATLRGWSIDNLILARSAPPVDLSDYNFFQFNSGVYGNIRPDVVPGKPLYLYGPQYPGGKAFNPLAFTDPPVDPATGNPTRQGNFPRNKLRGFGAIQWDFAVHRDFPIHELLKLQFRAELFNVLNHPNFGPPYNQFGANGFGLSTETLGQSLTGLGAVGSGGFNPLYQMGGPRSIQLGLKLIF